VESIEARQWKISLAVYLAFFARIRSKGKRWMASEQSSNGGTCTNDDLVLRRKRALYRAQHRGTKEMDWMVGKYAEARLATMTPEALTCFEEFLEVGDTEIHNWLFGAVVCDDRRFAPLVQDIRSFNSLH